MRSLLPVSVAAALSAGLFGWGMDGSAGAVVPESEVAVAAVDASAPAPSELECGRDGLAAMPHARPIGDRARAEAAEPEAEGTEEPPQSGPRILPLDLETVDAESGRTLHAPWGCGKEPAEFSSDPEKVLVDPASPSTTVNLSVTAPGGFLTHDALEIRFTASRYAARLIAVYPLRREADLSVLLSAADGRLVREGVLRAVVESTWVETVVSDATERIGGAVAIRGLPFFRGAVFGVDAEVVSRDGKRQVALGGRLPYQAELPVVARMTLPALADDVVALRFGHGGHRMICCGGCCCGHPADDGLPTGALTLRVLRRGGAPAALAHVRLDPVGLPRDRESQGVDLGADGTIRVGSLAAGRWSVQVREAGILAFSSEVEVRAGETVDKDLCEPLGGEIEVVVVDEEGRPLPYASLSIAMPTGLDWVDLDRDVQRIDPYTDVLGRRVLASVEPGEVTVGAVYGDRRAKEKVRVEDGARTVVRLEVR